MPVDQVIWQFGLRANNAATDAVRDELVGFLKAHDIDPAVVPGDTQIVVRQHWDGLRLHLRRHVLGGGGQPLLCPHCPACVQTEPVVVPLLVVPPAVEGAFVLRPILAEEVAGGRYPKPTGFITTT